MGVNIGNDNLWWRCNYKNQTNSVRIKGLNYIVGNNIDTNMAYSTEVSLPYSGIHILFTIFEKLFRYRNNFYFHFLFHGRSFCELTILFELTIIRIFAVPVRLFRFSSVIFLEMKFGECCKNPLYSTK